MKNIQRITVYILLILFIFSNFLAFSDGKITTVIEAKNDTEFEKILSNQLSLKNDTISIKYFGNSSSIKTLIQNILDKNAYVRSTIKEIEYSYREYPSYVSLVFQPKYINTKEEELLASKKIDSILATIITDDMYTHEKVKAVNDYIVLNGQYDTSLKNYSHYELLFEGRSVCNGYSLLAYNMLKKLNIPVLLVPGVAFNGTSNEGHVWNLVNIGGYWFNLDTTWNDPLPDRTNEVSYDYFLLTDEQLNKNHKADKNIVYPKAVKSFEDYLREFNNNIDNLITTPTTSGINIKIHDSYVDFTRYDKTPVKPFIENNRTLVPLRAVFNELGFDIDWNNSTNTATVTDGNKTLSIKPNALYATINGTKKALEVPAKLINGRIMVPVRFISEAFDNVVLWDGENQTVLIY